MTMYLLCWCRSEIELRCPVSGCVRFMPGRRGDVAYDGGRDSSDPSGVS